MRLLVVTRLVIEEEVADSDLPQGDGAANGTPDAGAADGPSEDQETVETA